MGKRLAILCTLIFLNGFLAYKVVWGTNGLLAHAELKAEQHAAEEQCRLLDESNRLLSKEIRLLQTDTAYMEKMVRERLHYLRENEILYLFDDKRSGNRSGNYSR